MTTLIILAVLAIGGLFLYGVNRQFSRRWVEPTSPFPKNWRIILKQEVNYYKALDQEQQKLFEYKVQEFLANCTITGVEVKVTDRDRVLIAASAVIPIFAFPSFKYRGLQEVLLYPRNFNDNFQVEGEERRIQGMVGTGYMNGKMILSRPALIQGFRNATDKRNTAVHEFIHLLDKADGQIDGIPAGFLAQPYVIPWVDMMEKKLAELRKEKKDIDDYAMTNREEFFAVVGEYFFERPILLKRKHPALYSMLEEIFDQDPLVLEKRWKKR
ncbi:MAG: M90 family metallopeptidase [Bacteroidota bacterium]